MDLIQRRVFISGRVQGVGYRAATVKAATRFSSLRGYVRNLSDKRVEAVFCGNSDEVDRMVAWCRKGPLLSSVKDVEVQDETADPSLELFAVQSSA